MSKAMSLKARIRNLAKEKQISSAGDFAKLYV
jgi:hypothetical protein